MRTIYILTLRELSKPLSTATLTWDAITTTLSAHFNPARNIHVERKYFRERARKTTESFNEYALGQIATTCNFGSFLDDALSEQFLQGPNHRDVQAKILSETGNFNALVSAAYRIQEEIRCASNITPTTSINNIHKDKDRRHNKGQKGKFNQKKNFPCESSNINYPPKGKRKLHCYGCEGEHDRKGCPFKNSVCNKCGITGHIEKACKKQNEQNGKVGQISEAPVSKTTHSIPGDPSDLRLVQSNEERRRYTTVHIENIPVRMQVYSGATYAVVDEYFYTNHLMHLRIHPAPPLNACTEDAIRTIGQVTVHARYLNSEHRLPMVITKG
jgi:hypothetical protein